MIFDAVPPAASSNPGAQLWFHSTEPDSTFRCELGFTETPAFEIGPCVSPKIYPFGPSCESYAFVFVDGRGGERVGFRGSPASGRSISDPPSRGDLERSVRAHAGDHGVVRVQFERGRDVRVQARRSGHGDRRVRALRVAEDVQRARRRLVHVLDVRDRSGREWLVDEDAIVHGRSERDADAEPVADAHAIAEPTPSPSPTPTPSPTAEPEPSPSPSPTDARRPTAPTCRSPISRPWSRRSPSPAARATRQRPPRSRCTSCTPTSAT